MTAMAQRGRSRLAAGAVVVVEAGATPGEAAHRRPPRRKAAGAAAAVAAARVDGATVPGAGSETVEEGAVFLSPQVGTVSRRGRGWRAGWKRRAVGVELPVLDEDIYGEVGGVRGWREGCEARRAVV